MASHGSPNRGKHPMTLSELVAWYTRNRTEEAGNCLLFTGPVGNNGYPKVTWNGKDHSLHRLVCERWFGPPPLQGRFSHAMHACGNHRCINPLCLSWGNAELNYLDTVRHGRLGKRKLTELQVRRCRDLYAAGASASSLARMLGISNVNMLRAVKRQSYRWVE